MISDTLKQKLSLLPMEPGCYLMKDAFGTIIYVGKAKKLKNRVNSYFTGAHDYKTTKLVSQIHDFDFIITSTEKESLILEINLIKEHKPRYNIMFMDDKMYPYIRVPKSGKPELKVVRDRKMLPNFLYFGPYPDAAAAHRIVEVLNQSVPDEDGNLYPNTLAIYEQFNRTTKRYTSHQLDMWRNQIMRLLNGSSQIFQKNLENKMNEAAEALNFELAQKYKEHLRAFVYNNDRQQVQLKRDEMFDVFNYDIRQGYLAIVGLFVRAGRLIERTMAMEATLEEPEDAFISFLATYYDSQPMPKQIYVPDSIPLGDISDILSTKVDHAKRGQKRKLLEIAKKNATQQLTDQFEILKQQTDFKESGLKALREILKIEKPIHRIEIFDNSHISGNFAVSACVVFDDGEPNRKMYRKYQLHQGNDDVASMEEVLYRRYLRLLKEQAPLPDLILVDGGKGQIGAALRVLESLDLDIPVAGLVKDERHRTRALMTSGLKTLELITDKPLFALMTHMQDEVHRVVISYHKILRKKAMTKSVLEEVPGLGKKRIQILLKHFGSLKGIKSASIESLEEVIPTDVARELYAILHIDWNDSNEKN